jgi:hypothetical protein
VVVNQTLSFSSAHEPNLSEIFISGMGWGLAMAVEPNLRIALRWNPGNRFFALDIVIASGGIIGTVGIDLRDQLGDLIEQLTEDFAVVTAVIRHHAERISPVSQMRLAPGTTLADDMLPRLSLTLAIDFHTRAINHHMTVTSLGQYG